MTEFKETVTTSQDAGVDETGASVQQKTRNIDRKVSADSTSTAANIVWYCRTLQYQSQHLTRHLGAYSRHSVRRDAL